MKKIIALITVVSLVLAFSITAFALGTSTPTSTPQYGYGYCTGGHNFMWDENGNILNREDAEARLDQFIQDGYVQDTDKDYYLEMYDYCVDRGWTNTGCGFGRNYSSNGSRGGCCGRRR